MGLGWRRRGTGGLCLPVCTFILLEEELEQGRRVRRGGRARDPAGAPPTPGKPCPAHLHRRGCGGRRRLAEGPGPLGLTGLIVLFLTLLNGRGLPGRGGSGAPAELPSWALGCLSAPGVGRQVGGQWVVDVMGRLAVVCRDRWTGCQWSRLPPSPAGRLPASPRPQAPSSVTPGAAPRQPPTRLPQLPHIQSLPPRSCGRAPPLLGTPPPEGSPRTAPRPGCGGVRLPPARRQSQAPLRGPGSQALAARKKGQ